MSVEAYRPTAGDILEAVLDNARNELRRDSMALGFSAFAAGLAMGLTGLAVAASHNLLRGVPGQEFVPVLFYPVGFIAVIIGRQQLFTENTLYPVALVLDERRGRHVFDTARLWVVVFVLNVLGTLAFSAFMMKTGAIDASIRTELVALGERTVAKTWTETFASAIVAGWLIALVAWLVAGASRTIGQILLIWTFAFVVGAAHLAHCIASSAEALNAAVVGDLAATRFLGWLSAATLGNIVGGVMIVAILNYAQVVAGESDDD